MGENFIPPKKLSVPLACIENIKAYITKTTEGTIGQAMAMLVDVAPESLKKECEFTARKFFQGQFVYDRYLLQLAWMLRNWQDIADNCVSEEIADTFEYVGKQMTGCKDKTTKKDLSKKTVKKTAVKKKARKTK